MKKVFVLTIVSVFVMACSLYAEEKGQAATSNQPSSSEQVKAKFFTDYPELKDRWDTMSDWDRVRYLRTWTWGKVDMCWPPNMYDSKPGWYELSAAETIEWFEKDRGGVWCGGTCSTLVRILHDFGFEAYGMGIYMIPPATEWGSHAIALVKIKDHRGRDIWSLQDAYFNDCVADANGNPLDYVEFLQCLKAGKHKTVQLLSHEMPIKQWPGLLVCPEMREGRTYQEMAGMYQMMDHEKFRPVEIGDEWVKLLTPRTAEQYEVRFYYFKEILAANGWPTDSIYAFLFAKQSFNGPESYLKKMQAVLGDTKLKPLPYPKYKVWFSTSAYREMPWKWSTVTIENKPAALIVPSAGEHVVNLWAGEPRVPLDRLILTKDKNYKAEGKGPAKSNKDLIVVEAEDFDESIERSGAFWVTLTRQTTDHTGRGLVCSQPQIFNLTHDNAPELRYKIKFPSAGVWYVFVRENVVMPTNDLIYIGLDDKLVFAMEFYGSK